MSCYNRPSLLGLLLLLLSSLLLLSPCHALLQTAALDVFLDGIVNDDYSLPSYTLLATQASFGSYPTMQAQNNPSRKLVTPPNDNPLLCKNVASSVPTSSSSSSLSSSSSENTIMLVPRGECTFETKAFEAQQLGAQAIIIYGTLASRYSLNTTENKTEYSTQDIVFPLEYYDYDCDKGQADIPLSAVSFDPLPYNAAQNDPILSGDSSFQNICRKKSANHLQDCPSKACLLTGKNKSKHQDEQDNTMIACCAWDLHIWLYHDPTFNDTTTRQVTIPAAYITMEQGNRLLRDLKQQTMNNIEIVLYARWRPSYNVSSYLIWALGVLVAGLAAYLSASDYHQYYRKVALQGLMNERGRSESSTHRERPARPQYEHDESMELTACHALGFVILASTSLLVLFYFKIYGLVKVLYALGCSKAVSQVLLDPLIGMAMKNLGVQNNIVWRTNTEDFGDIRLRDVVSHVLGYAWGILWLIVSFTHRHAEDLAFVWITQNFFGACMCIMFLQVIKLNSVRVASILLLVAFFYDIFFVFISPLLFKGKSVMITVATSGGPPTADPSWCEKYPDDPKCQGGDPLPMLLAIPRINDFAGGSSLLGLGDIVLPGLLISFAARFDAAKSLLGILGGGNGSLNSYSCPERKFCGNCGLCSGGYFVPLVIAYAIGLAMANTAVYLMNMGQPALLYLVPCCLGTMTFMGWRRSELQDLWDGPRAIRSADKIVYGDYEQAGPPTSDHAPLPTEEGLADAPAVPSAAHDGRDEGNN